MAAPLRSSSPVSVNSVSATPSQRPLPAGLPSASAPSGIVPVSSAERRKVRVRKLCTSDARVLAARYCSPALPSVA